MKSEHRSLLAIVLSIVVILVWYSFFAEKPAPKQVRQENTQGQATETAKSLSEKKVEVAPEIKESSTERAGDIQAGLPEKETILENEKEKIVFSNKGALPLSWQLKKYKQSADKDSPLINFAHEEEGLAPTLSLSFKDANFYFPEKPTYKLVSSDKQSVVYEWKSNEIVLRKTIKLDPESYLLGVGVTVQNQTGKALKGTPVLTVSGTSMPAKKSGFFGFLKQPPANNSSPVLFLDGKVKREKKIQELPLSQVISPDPQKGGGLYWAGLEDRYFINAVIPRTLSSGVSAIMGAEKLSASTPGSWGIYSGVALAPLSVVAGGTVEAAFSIYAGPKEIDELKAVGVNLDKAIDYGWFSVIAMPILYLLKIFYKVVHNYGIAIILLTIFIKMLLHPINMKSMKSMKAMQTLQPKLKELQQKYKDDKQRLNVETMQLFKTHKVNPMGGCLPMLAQFPVYIALYRVLWNSIELYHAPFFWFYNDLSAPDPYLITPILLGVGMLLQQKIMPSTTADPTQKKMMMMMPIMFTVFMVFLPVGLVIYILVNTVMSVATQWMYNKEIRLRDVAMLKIKKP